MACGHKDGVEDGNDRPLHLFNDVPHPSRMHKYMRFGLRLSYCRLDPQVNTYLQIPGTIFLQQPPMVSCHRLRSYLVD